MILTLRTDNPQAEVGVYSPAGEQLAYRKWLADRQLAKQLLTIIREQLQAAQGAWADITGVVVFEGPGSFTGLRIGITVADAIAYGNGVPIVATRGDNWLQLGLKRLQSGENDKIALPHYGAEANITLPKK